MVNVPSNKCSKQIICIVLYRQHAGRIYIFILFLTSLVYFKLCSSQSIDIFFCIFRMTYATWLLSTTMQHRGHKSWTSVKTSGIYCWTTPSTGGGYRTLAASQATCLVIMSRRRSLRCLTGEKEERLFDVGIATEKWKLV